MPKIKLLRLLTLYALVGAAAFAVPLRSNSADVPLSSQLMFERLYGG